MLSNDTAYRLDHAVTDDKIGDEIAARLISATPGSPSAAQAVLDILDPSAKMQAKISERLYVALAGDADGRAGKELAKKINGMIAVLQAKADGSEIAAEAAQFQGQVAGMTTDVTIDADTAGAAGNVTLVQNGDDIDTLISDWNIANPANTLTLSAGDGSQIPTANIVLSGGSNASDGNLAPAKAAMGSEQMSDEAYDCLKHALGDKAAADEFKAAYNAMIAAVQAIS